MADLIARLETAGEGSRELDEDIALASGLWRAWLSKHRYWNFDGPGDRHFSWPQGSIPRYNVETGEEIVLTDVPWHDWCWDADLPEFTVSLDAALMLVPEGWRPSTLNWSWSTPTSLVSIYKPDEIGFPVQQCSGEASTPALALCIAALKAREKANG